MLPGVYPAKRKDGTPYFRAGIHYKNKHISLGSYTEESLAHLRERQISYVLVSDATDLRAGFEAVGREFGIRSVSVQGGGILNGALLAEGLIDELSLVVYPGIDGLSGVPSIFEYTGGITEYPAQGQRLQLLSASQREHGVMWIQYKFHKDYRK